MNRVNQNLEKIAKEIEAKVEKALYVSATLGAGYAHMLTPVDTSNLINSQYIKLIPSVNGWSAKIGYTANYAAAVHSKKGTLRDKPRPDGNSNYWDPSGEPKFLTKGFEQNASEIRQVFFRAMKL